MTVKIRGVAALARQLKGNLDQTLKPAYVAIAELVRSEVAPYPPAVPPSPPSWYERGYGTKYRKRDGGVTGRKTSQMLGRRWSVTARGNGAVVENSASYAPFVHSYEQQTLLHGARGWVTDREAIQRVVNSGAWERMLITAVNKALNE